MRRTGDASSIASLANPELNVAPRTSNGPRLGIAAQIIRSGRIPRTTITAKKKPQVKKKRLAFCPIPERTSALITALSIEVIISKRDKPKIVRIIKTISIYNFLILSNFCFFYLSALYSNQIFGDSNRT